jgi:hypothetical protein
MRQRELSFLTIALVSFKVLSAHRTHGACLGMEKYGGIGQWRRCDGNRKDCTRKAS